MVGSKAGRCRSRLAGDADISVNQEYPVDAIAAVRRSDKRAPTEKAPGSAWFFCVIVNEHRRQAGSYSGLRLPLPLLYTTQAGCQAAVLWLLILILGAPSNTLAGIR